jgi:hypothetical protein
VQLNIRGDVATSDEVLGYATKWRDSLCTRGLNVSLYQEVLVHWRDMQQSVGFWFTPCPFSSEFFFETKSSVDVVIFPLRHLWFLHKSRSIDGNHNIDHVPSSEFVSCFLGLYSILRMKRELVGKTMIYFLCESKRHPIAHFCVLAPGHRMSFNHPYALSFLQRLRHKVTGLQGICTASLLSGHSLPHSPTTDPLRCSIFLLIPSQLPSCTR